MLVLLTSHKCGTEDGTAALEFSYEYPHSNPDRQPVPGSIGDTPTDHECEPYVEVPVPENAESILTGSDDDPNVQCAVALDEAAAVFGTRFQPVVVGDPDFSQCVFVEPDRLLEIEFDIWSDPLDRETTYTDTTDRDFAGRPGRVRTDGEDHWAKASTSATRDEGGTLNLSVRTGPLTSGPVTPENIAAVETVLTEILRIHFA